MALDPSQDEVRRGADRLVPADALITHVGENTGPKLFVGDFFAVRDFRVGDEDVFAAIDRQIPRAGYVVRQRRNPAESDDFYVERGGLRARINVDPDGSGTVIAEADPRDKRAHRWVGLWIGVATALGVLGWWLAPRPWAWRHR